MGSTAFDSAPAAVHGHRPPIGDPRLVILGDDSGGIPVLRTPTLPAIAADRYPMLSNGDTWRARDRSVVWEGESYVKSHVMACLLTLAVSGGVWAQSQIDTVKVTGGTVQGVSAGNIVSFKGIPFAAPPTGLNRWRAPQPVRAWSGVKRADTFSPGCMQDPSMAVMFGADPKVSEDCLYLNVWTPAHSSSERLPVMVWIYGGGFSAGMTSIPLYDGTRLAQQGVIVVSIAYRVGPFGFLAARQLARESKGTGNYGLLDLIAGLQWVKKNIEGFGGDAAQVTIFGESAGGVAVSMLAASPLAKGLFQRAISESGGNFQPPKFANEAGLNGLPLKLAEKEGEQFLTNLGTHDIMAARTVSADLIQRDAGSAAARFWPVFDGYVLPGDEYELYELNRFNDTPVLIGTNSDEGALFARPGVTANSFRNEVQQGYDIKANSILAAYPSSTDTEAATSSKNLLRDTAFAWPTWAWARLQSRVGKSLVFVYYFDHRTPLSPEGATHGAEMQYVFGNLDRRQGAPSAADVALSEHMMKYWVNFAKTGDPNGPGLPSWPAFNQNSEQVLYIDATIAAKPVPNLAQLQVLNDYFSWRRAEADKR
jgi:para-nitrobenzyl esterase